MEKDFMKKIDIRQKFKSDYPKEFNDYMNNVFLEVERPSICFGCKHYKSPNCELSLFPKQNKYLDAISFTCSSFEKGR